MLVLIPNIKFIKRGNIEATDIVIKVFIVSNVLIVGSALLFTFFD